MFENRVLRRIFGPKRDELRGNGENYIMRRLMICTAELTVWAITSKIGWTVHVARMYEKRGAYRVLVGKPEGKRPLDIPTQ